MLLGVSVYLDHHYLSLSLDYTRPPSLTRCFENHRSTMSAIITRICKEQPSFYIIIRSSKQVQTRPNGSVNVARDDDTMQDPTKNRERDLPGRKISLLWDHSSFKLLTKRNLASSGINSSVSVTNKSCGDPQHCTKLSPDPCNPTERHEKQYTDAVVDESGSKEEFLDARWCAFRLSLRWSSLAEPSRRASASAYLVIGQRDSHQPVPELTRCEPL